MDGERRTGSWRARQDRARQERARHDRARQDRGQQAGVAALIGGLAGAALTAHRGMTVAATGAAPSGGSPNG